MPRPKIIVILGPTASGKSNIAVAIAKKFNGEIISADSRQVYKGLDIGTGKITKKEMAGVPHHLLSVADPRKQFTVTDDQTLTNLAIARIVNIGKAPIICGGTGFYISALLGEINIPEAKPNKMLRKQLEKKSIAELFEILQKLDPVRAGNIDRQNPRRLVRAIEVAKTLGSVPELPIRNSKSEIRNKFKILKIGIKLGKEELRKRINERLGSRIKKGMIDEAKQLYEHGLSYKRMRELGLEYRRLADFFEGKISKRELITLLQNEIWQYAKRQMTWFKRDKNILWFPPSIKKVEKEVKNFLKM